MGERILKKVLLLFFSLVFILSSNNFALAEDQYSADLIPTMTDNSSPFGIASASSEYTQADGRLYAFNAFDDTSNSPYDTFSTNLTISGWLSYEFLSPKIISKYTIEPQNHSYQNSGPNRAPKDWTFEGSNDGIVWIVLDTQTNVTDYTIGVKKSFTFTNQTEYKIYRLNFTENNGDPQFTSIGELEMMEKITAAPDPDPNPAPQPTGDKALLVISLVSGAQKEYDLRSSEIEEFLDWYEDRAEGRGKEAFVFDKDYNRGPFTKRNEYIVFSKIESFEVTSVALM